MDATSAAKASSQLRFRRPFSASTSSDDPTFTTTRLASDKRRAAVLRSAVVIRAQYCHLLEQAASPNISLHNEINRSTEATTKWVESTNQPSGSGMRTWKMRVPSKSSNLCPTVGSYSLPTL